MTLNLEQEVIFLLPCVNFVNEPDVAVLSMLECMHRTDKSGGNRPPLKDVDTTQETTIFCAQLSDSMQQPIMRLRQPIIQVRQRNIRIGQPMFRLCQAMIRPLALLFVILSAYFSIENSTDLSRYPPYSCCKWLWLIWPESHTGVPVNLILPDIFPPPRCYFLGDTIQSRRKCLKITLWSHIWCRGGVDEVRAFLIDSRQNTISLQARI